MTLEALRAVLLDRGCVLSLRDGRRLRISHASQLTPDEYAAIQEHLGDLIALLSDSEPKDVPRETSSNESTPTLEPPAAICSYCYKSPCIGPKDPNYRVLHANSEEELQRRRDEATEMMLRTADFRHLTRTFLR